MEKSRVALVQCDSYDADALLEAVRNGMQLLGGADRFATAGEKILLKPNVLAGDPPEKAVATHPAVLKAAALVFREISSNITYGDSPGFGNADSQFEKAQLLSTAREIDLKQADFDNGNEIVFPDSPFIKKFPIASGASQADCMISLSKLKTHMLTRMTGAVKNQFGCIPGRAKKGFHIKLPDPFDFSRMLVSLSLALKPRLYIMDGILAMEGNGPRGGDPVRLNALLFSDDPVALDATACRLVEMDPLNVPTMEIGRELGLGTYLAEEIELLGEPLSSLVNGDFKADRSPLRETPPVRIPAFIKNLTTDRPVVNREKCVRCGACIAACPAEPPALAWRGRNRKHPPVYRSKSCIRCYCCQEICPEGAITSRGGLLGSTVRHTPRGS